MSEAAEVARRVFCSRVGVEFFIAPADALAEDEINGELRLALHDAISAGDHRIVVDLSDVPRIDSNAMEILLDAQEALLHKGGRLKCIEASELVMEALQISGFVHYVPTAPAGGASAKPATQKESDSGKLGEILARKNLISEAQLNEALAIQARTGQRLGEIITERDWLDERAVLQALADQLAIPMVRLRPGLYDPAVLAELDPRTARRLNMLPLFRVHGVVAVATANPQDMPSLSEIESRLRCTVKPVLARIEDIQQCLASDFDDYDIPADFADDISEDFEVVENLAPEDYASIDEMAAGSPIINLVNSLIHRAIRDRASDIHIEAGRKVARVRYRIDGLLYEAATPRIELHPAIVSRLKVMANLDIAERRLPQDGRIQVHTQQKGIDLRFSSLPGLYGEKVVLRVLDKSQAILDVNRLGMTEDNLDTYLKLMRQPHGLVLVTGPTGSGKTTSLYAALNSLNSPEKNIVTIEDPVEYQIDQINQNEVRDKIGLGFAKMLKHVLRQDPDIVMVGEIRDAETARIAVQAALTGHLVLSTLHTNDAPGAITRMVDFGVEPYLLASSLIGVLAQRLVRRICPGCRTEYTAPKELVAQHGWTEDTVTLSRGRGCEDCYDSGYKGRLAIHEILEMEPRLQQLILADPTRDALLAYVEEQGVATLAADGIGRAREHLTTVEEVARVTAG